MTAKKLKKKLSTYKLFKIQVKNADAEELSQLYSSLNREELLMRMDKKSNLERYRLLVRKLSYIDSRDRSRRDVILEKSLVDLYQAKRERDRRKQF